MRKLLFSHTAAGAVVTSFWIASQIESTEQSGFQIHLICQNLDKLLSISVGND